MARIREKANELAKKKLDRWTFHDLKRTIGTGMREYLKPPVDRAVVDLVLAHAPEGPAATSRYDRAPMLDDRNEALNRWAKSIKVTVSGPRKVPGKKVGSGNSGRGIPEILARLSPP